MLFSLQAGGLPAQCPERAPVRFHMISRPVREGCSRRIRCPDAPPPSRFASPSSHRPTTPTPTIEAYQIAEGVHEAALPCSSPCPGAYYEVGFSALCSHPLSPLLTVSQCRCWPRSPLKRRDRRLGRRPLQASVPESHPPLSLPPPPSPVLLQGAPSLPPSSAAGRRPGLCRCRGQ